jgi:hypothetical protein
LKQKTNDPTKNSIFSLKNDVADSEQPIDDGFVYLRDSGSYRDCPSG